MGPPAPSSWGRTGPYFHKLLLITPTCVLWIFTSQTAPGLLAGHPCESPPPPPMPRSPPHGGVELGDTHSSSPFCSGYTICLSCLHLASGSASLVHPLSSFLRERQAGRKQACSHLSDEGLRPQALHLAELAQGAMPPPLSGCPWCIDFLGLLEPITARWVARNNN